MQPKTCLKTHKIQTHQHPQTLTLLVLKQAQKLKSKLKDSQEVLALVLSCLMGVYQV